MISVVVKPGSSKGNKVEQAADGYLVYVKERAVDGAANEAVIALLAEYFGVRKKDITIKSGVSARKKLVVVGGPKGT